MKNDDQRLWGVVTLLGSRAELKTQLETAIKLLDEDDPLYSPALARRGEMQHVIVGDAADMERGPALMFMLRGMAAATASGDDMLLLKRANKTEGFALSLLESGEIEPPAGERISEIQRNYLPEVLDHHDMVSALGHDAVVHTSSGDVHQVSLGASDGRHLWWICRSPGGPVEVSASRNSVHDKWSDIYTSWADAIDHLEPTLLRFFPSGDDEGESEPVDPSGGIGSEAVAAATGAVSGEGV